MFLLNCDVEETETAKAGSEEPKIMEMTNQCRQLWKLHWEGRRSIWKGKCQSRKVESQDWKDRSEGSLSKED